MPDGSCPMDRVMRERIFWLPAIIMLGLFGAGAMSPALGGGGGHAGSGHGGGVRGGGVQGRSVHGGGVHRFGASVFRPAPFGRVPPSLIRGNLVAPRVVPRHFAVGNDLPLRRRVPFENSWPIGIWPLWPNFDTTPMVVPSSGSDVPTSPPVIVVSGLPSGAPERTASATLPDYSYVAGCHAIPQGYHCDAPHDGEAP
jgi:hypothetical protein